MTMTAEAGSRERRSTSDPPMRAILEALLYASAEPVTEAELIEAFGSERAEEVREALAALIEEYRADGRGLTIEQVAGGHRIVTRPELADVLREFVKRRNRTRLSRAALETLSIVAYRQPVTAPEIESIRGVNPQAILRSLLDRRMVRMAGRKKVVGKPFLYATTPEFLLYFGLNSLDDLPSMEEFAGIIEAMAPPREEEASAPPREEPPREEEEDATPRRQGRRERPDGPGGEEEE